MNRIKFHKYIAAGNDFLLFNGFNSLPENLNQLAIRSCDRHFGIGADGIMVCKESENLDIQMLYFNSDGSQGEMCGNGIRSFAKYIYDNNILKKKSISVETLAGPMYIEIESDSHDRAKFISVDMGFPEDLKLEKIIQIDGKDYIYSYLRLGVPHLVIFVEDIKFIDINDLGRKIEIHQLFPQKTNVNFIEVLNKDEINIYTWERGAGRTLGCGTGSCASVFIGNTLNILNNNVEVNTEGGGLKIEIKDNKQIIMKGIADLIGFGDYIL